MTTFTRAVFLFLAACTLFAVSERTVAFGNNGHEIVGAIADELIQGTPAEAKVKALLPDMSLAEASTWADRAKGGQGPLTEEMKDFTAGNPDHHGYHYTDVPIQELTYQLGRAGTKPIDIVQIATQCINVLRGNDSPTTNPHRFSPRIALILLTHLAGDIHQPLHVGSAYINKKNRFVNPNVVLAGVEEDQGGNYLKFKSTVLHSYWDANGVQRAMSKVGAHTPATFAEKVLETNPVVPQTPGAVETWPTRWATEMLPVAAKAHKGFKLAKPITVTDHFGTHLQWAVTAPLGYEDLVRGIVEDRLTTAGFRLAQLLQAIFP